MLDKANGWNKVSRGKEILLAKGSFINRKEMWAIRLC